MNTRGEEEHREDEAVMNNESTTKEKTGRKHAYQANAAEGPSMEEGDEQEQDGECNEEQATGGT